MGMIDSIADAITGKKKKTDPNVKSVEEMEDPVGNPDRPLTAGEIHKIDNPNYSKSKVAKP